MASYILEKGGITEFEFNWNNNCLPGHGESKGTTMDYVLNLASVSKYVSIINATHIKFSN
jgi:hypothetical protein